MTATADHVQGKTVLVTGGSGSIGRELVRDVLERRPRALRILSNDEHGVFELQRELGPRPEVRYLLGDVRDADRMARAMSGVDVVYHAAALKHVPLCEYNPFEAMKTNVVGTQNCIDAALDAGVGRFVLVSTDKAVNPINTMGATKFLAERLVIDANKYKGASGSVFACVRFGNVLDSRGSVVQVFRDQLLRGERPTVTDPGMTRFVMPIPDATRLILGATGLSQGGEIFILKMPVIRIGDLLAAVAADARPDLDPAKLDPRLIGLREGEKLHEELMTLYESRNALETPDMFIVGGAARLDPAHYRGATPAKEGEYTSRDGPFLSPGEIRALLASRRQP